MTRPQLLVWRPTDPENGIGVLVTGERARAVVGRYRTLAENKPPVLMDGAPAGNQRALEAL